MSTFDRRTILAFGGSAAALSLLPLAGCGGGDVYPSVAQTPMGPLAAAADGRQYQALGKAHALVVTDRNGLQKRYGGVGQGRGKLNYPAGLAVLGGLAYVVETGNHRVQVFDGNVASVGTFGESELLYPGAIAAGKDEIFVADSRHARIVVYTPSGLFKRVLGAGTLSAPRGMQVVDGGGLLVADPGLRKVLKLGPDGSVQAELGANWVLPWDVASDGSYVYVADVSTSELAVLSLGGEYLDKIPLKTAAANVWFKAGTLHVAPIA
jgi:DNA-binding beta-propeller fold protein YncE